MTAEDAINVFKEQFCGLEVYCEIHRDGLCLTDDCEVWWAIKALEQYKADVQSERKKGRWIDTESSYADGVRQECRCSVCSRLSPRPLGDFCRWCSADMRGDEDG